MGTAPGAPVLSIRGVRKVFGELVVLDGVDLDLLPAENVAVLGRSGSGKSVLIKILVGLLAADAGEISVLGRPLAELRPRALDELRVRVGFSFQGGALYDSMTVRENLEFPLRQSVRRLPEAEIDRRVNEVLEGVGLLDTRDRVPAQLSGGQRKRISIARTLVLEPEIMLYDEPTSGLDPVTSGEINDLILAVRRTRRTSAIVITHDLTCARRVADRVAVLIDGRLARVGPFDEVFDTADPRIRAFFDYNFVHPRAEEAP